MIHDIERVLEGMTTLDWIMLTINGSLAAIAVVMVYIFIERGC